MIYVAIIICLISGTTHSVRTTPDVVDIGVKTNGGFLASASNADASDACRSRYSCVNCTAARVCAPLADNQGFLEVGRVNCSGNTPFCDYETGTCTSTQSQRCASKGDFICMRDGYFPDQSVCTKFHYCNNSQAYTFTCLLSYYYYDSMSEACVYYKGCYNFKCDGRNGYKVRYPADGSIYAFCVGNTALVIDRCPGKEQLNETSQECEPTCTKDGLMEDPDDCTGYYKCSIASQVSTTVTYTMTHESCPHGQAYSQTAYQCVPIAQVPGCNVESVGSTTTTATAATAVVTTPAYTSTTRRPMLQNKLSSLVKFN